MFNKLKRFLHQATRGDLPTVEYFERQTVDNDYFGGNVFGLVVSPEEDNDWKLKSLDDLNIKNKSASEILDILADSSPDLSRALWDTHQNIVTEWTWETNENDEAGNRILQEAADQMELVIGEPISTKIGKLVDSGFLKGALYAENVFQQERFVDIVILDPFDARFQRRKNDERGQFWQLGQDKDGMFEALESPYVRYVPLVPRTDKPYGRPVAGSAIYPIMFLLGLFKAVRQSMMLQAFPNRVITIDRKHLADAGYTPEEINNILTSLKNQLPQQVAKSTIGSQWVEGGEFKMEIIGGVSRVNYDGIEMMERMLERHIIRGLKQFPINFAITEGTALSSGNADQQLHKEANSIDSFMRVIEKLFSIYGTQILNNAGSAATATFQLKRNSALTEKLIADKMDVKVDLILKANGDQPLVTPMEARQIFKQPDGLERLSKILADDGEFEQMLKDKEEERAQLMNPPGEDNNSDSEDDPNDQEGDSDE